MRALGIPTPATHVFHRKDEAAEWARDAVYPLIFKLRGGSASSNIHFVRDASQARRIIDRMFAAGMRDRGAVQAFRDGLGGASGGRDLARLGGKVLRRLAAAPRRITGARERDYAYFQEFIPGLDFDIRAVVVGERCWAFRRAVREGDFRASGSKRFIHDPESIPEECIRLAFDVARRLGTQSLALDILLREGEPLVLEFSYAFSLVGYKGCDGYWTPDMGWVARRPQPERFMLEDLIGLVATTERRGG
jgi:glutathione synthase/RimK-type ligase-like ATP-grasp enzyme